MMRCWIALGALVVSLHGVSIAVAQTIGPRLTDQQLAAMIVRASREAYYRTGHPCACPDDVMRNGRRCGARNAYSRPGGASPLCYVSDVSAQMITQYRKIGR